MSKLLTISVVSHKQLELILELLWDVAKHCSHVDLEVILTLNLSENHAVHETDYLFPVSIIYNSRPQGFGANHNQAFRQAKGKFFCVVNPDIRFSRDPFLNLISCLKNSQLGVVAPVVLNAHGVIEDSARTFPTPLRILCKAFGKCKWTDYEIHNAEITPDWVGGMFMLFRSEVFQKLGGFNERYFLYYEDVDLCARLRLAGYEVMLTPKAQVVHHAQRSSHRNFKYLRWHITSMLRFFLSAACWRLQYRKWTENQK